MSGFTEETRAKIKAAREAKGPQPSLRKAIDLMCKSCLYEEGGGGTWRQQIEACTAPNCPLFPVRPRSKPKKRETEVDLPSVEDQG